MNVYLNGLDLAPTDALTIDTEKVLSVCNNVRAAIESQRRLIPTNPQDRIPTAERKIHRLEAQIVICRHMLNTNQGNKAENERFMSTAVAIYERHLESMLKFTQINLKVGKPPVIPISFTTEETSELYWSLVKFGSIDSIISQVERNLEDNKAILSELMRHAASEEQVQIRNIMEKVDLALREWRPKALEAVNNRSRAIKNMVSAEILKLNRPRPDQGTD